MKVLSLITEGNLFEQEIQIARGAANASDYVYDMLEDINALQELVYENKLSKEALIEIKSIVQKMEHDLENDDPEAIFEAVQRQFRRYGDKFVRQFRCVTGPKAGRMAANPAACGKRKDPRKVRQGKASARKKKGSRVRKTLFTKRKTQSKRLTRLNKVLRGEPGTSSPTTGDKG